LTKNTAQAYLYPDVAKQLQKDFAICGITLDFPTELVKSPEDTLFAVVYPAVKAVLKDQPNLMFKIIYRVDIAEHVLGRVMENKTGEVAYVSLTQLIIDRETQKVKLRKAQG
jgi:hypothetical protein